MKRLGRYAVLFIIAVLLGGCSQKGGADETTSAKTPDFMTEEMKIGNEKASGNIDIAIVMDTSGSMLASDRERMAVEAAKMFIDMEKANGINVSVIEFSNTVKSEGMINITDSGAKEFLKDTLDRITYVNQAHTDTGAALREAVEELKHGDTEHKKAILLFTDGRTEITSGERTLEQSKADIDAAIAEASSMECPIYAVGLNYNGNVDENELTRMSLKTGGLTLIANDVNELPRFFNEIFKTLGNIEEISIGDILSDGEYQSVDIPIENDSILEANIVMLSNVQIQDIRLYDPDGREIPKEGGKIIFTSSAKYSVVKMLAPQSGNWRLEVKGISGDQIRISLLYNYNINMITRISQSAVHKGDIIEISAYLTNEGAMISDENFYGKMSAVSAVTSEKTGKTQVIPLIYRDNYMTGTYEVAEVSDLNIQVHMEGQGLYRDSDEIRVKAGNLEVVQTKKFAPLYLNKEEKGELDLNEYFEDPDGEELVFRVLSSNDQIIDTDVQGGILNYTSKDKVGKADITVEAKDPAGSRVQVVISGSTDTFFGRNKLPIAGLLVVILLVAAALTAAEIRKKATGYMLLSLSSRSADEYGSIENHIYSLAAGIAVGSLGRRFTLQGLLRSFAASYGNITYDREKVMELNQIIGSISGLAACVKFSPTSDKQKMKVAVFGNRVEFCDIAGNTLTNTKSQIITCDMSNPATFYIRINQENSDKACVVITIQYKILAV